MLMSTPRLRACAPMPCTEYSRSAPCLQCTVTPLAQSLQCFSTACSSSMEMDNKKRQKNKPVPFSVVTRPGSASNETQMALSNTSEITRASLFSLCCDLNAPPPPIPCALLISYIVVPSLIPQFEPPPPPYMAPPTLSNHPTPRSPLVLVLMQ